MGTAYYRPPGVYPEKKPNPALRRIFDAERIPVIVGPGAYYTEVTALVTRMPTGYDDSLPEDAISIVRVGDYPDQYRYHQNTDFTFTGDFDHPKSVIKWISGTTIPDANEPYYVTYHKLAADSQYQFHIYTDENEIFAVHGQPTTYNLVSVGARLALSNGAPQVGIIQLDLRDAVDIDNPTEDELYTAYINALDVLDLLDTDECRYVVPMTTMGGVPSDGDAHFSLWESYYDHVKDRSLTTNRRWRMLIRGMALNPTGTNTEVKEAAQELAEYFGAFANITGDDDNAARRVVIVFPGDMYVVLYDPTDKKWKSTLCDGSVLAAAAAGKICSFINPAITITYKQPRGLSTERIMSEQAMNQLATSGVCIFFYRRNVFTCRHAMTVDDTDASTQEICVVEVEDYIKTSSIYYLEDRYIGSPIVNGLTDSIEATFASMLERMITNSIIAEYDTSSLSVAQDNTDPRIINIWVRIKPAYPLNWIDIKFQFYAGPGT